MVYSYSIKKLLNIKDPNIQISDKVTIETIDKVTHHVVEGVLTCTPKAYAHCGVVNQSTADIIRYGYKRSTVKLTHINFLLVQLELDKQRFKCKHGCQSFMATTPLVDKGCFISNLFK